MSARQDPVLHPYFDPDVMAAAMADQEAAVDAEEYVERERQLQQIAAKLDWLTARQEQSIAAIERLIRVLGPDPA